jgi:hypothetical protein
MEQHYWWLFALLQPFGFAASTLINQHFQKSGTSVVTIRAMFTATALTPFIFFVELPTEPLFYIATFIAAILAFVADSLVLNSSVKFGAGTTSRLLPVSPLLGFILWLIFHPESFYKFLEYPYTGLCIVLSFITCIYAIFHLQKCDISKKAFIYLIPVIMVFGINDVMNKTAQDNSEFISGIIWYTFFLALISIITGLSLHLKNKTFLSSFKDKLLIKTGILVGIAYLTAMMGRNVSMAYTENPGYTSIIAGGTPLVIYLYHKLFNIEDKANVKAGLLFAISVLALIYFASSVK